MTRGIAICIKIIYCGIVVVRASGCIEHHFEKRMQSKRFMQQMNENDSCGMLSQFAHGRHKDRQVYVQLNNARVTKVVLSYFHFFISRNPTKAFLQRSHIDGLLGHGRQHRCRRRDGRPEARGSRHRCIFCEHNKIFFCNLLNVYNLYKCPFSIDRDNRVLIRSVAAAVDRPSLCLTAGTLCFFAPFRFKDTLIIKTLL